MNMSNYIILLFFIINFILLNFISWFPMWVLVLSGVASFVFILVRGLFLDEADVPVQHCKLW